MYLDPAWLPGFEEKFTEAYCCIAQLGLKPVYKYEGMHSLADTKASHAESASLRRGPRPGDIKLVAIDMDGTLLDSSSHVLPSSVDALRRALWRGVTIMLATGKARPAARAAMAAVGLAGVFLGDLLSPSRCNASGPGDWPPFMAAMEIRPTGSLGRNSS